MKDTNNPNNKLPWWRDGLISFVKIGASIAVPIIIALYLGQYLDNKYNSEPWIFLGLTFIAFTISMFFIYKNMMKYVKDAEDIELNK